MATPDRFEILAPLPSVLGFRRALAVDRGGPARAVVLAYPPARVGDDPERLAALVRDAEAAARVHHPHVLPVAGLETVGGAPAVVEVHRPGASVRDLLDAGGRLPPDVAARVVADACAGVAAIHALDPRDGRPLAHGALAAERVLVLESGAALVSGLATGAGTDPVADVRALAAILYECLAGEPPASPAAVLDAPGVAAPLAAVVDRALGAVPGGPFASAAALGAAIADALAPATWGAVAAYVEVVLPAGGGERAALTRLVTRALGSRVAGAPGAPDEISAELIVDGFDLRPTPMLGTPLVPAQGPAVPIPPPQRVALAPPPPPIVCAAALPRPAPPPPADRAATFPAPRGTSARSRAPVVAAAVCVSIGFALGFASTRGFEIPSVDSVRRALARSTPAPASPATPPESPAPARAPGQAEPATGTSASIASAAPTSPSTEAVEPARPERSAAASQASRGRGAAPARPPRTVAAAPKPAQKGFLDVTAPEEAEVFLDGKRIGTGSVRREIPDGAHRIEVRLGAAAVAERFTVAPGETWTYEVTPAP